MGNKRLRPPRDIWYKERNAMDCNSLRDILAFCIAQCDKDFRPVSRADNWDYQRADYILEHIGAHIRSDDARQLRPHSEDDATGN